MSDYTLTWITESLAVGHAPMSYDDLDYIRAQGIGAIVNLCGEFCDLHEIEEQSGFEVYFLPIPDETAPDMAELEKGDAEKVTLLWASRTLQDTFWMDKLLALKEKYGDKFEIVFILSRQDPPKDDDNIRYLHGRITPDVLKQVFSPPSQDEIRFQSVGTKEMMRCVDDMLTEIGYPVPEQHLLPKTK